MWVGLFFFFFPWLDHKSSGKMRWIWQSNYQPPDNWQVTNYVELWLTLTEPCSEVSFECLLFAVLCAGGHFASRGQTVPTLTCAFHPSPWRATRMKKRPLLAILFDPALNTQHPHLQPQTVVNADSSPLSVAPAGIQWYQMSQHLPLIFK